MEGIEPKQFREYVVKPSLERVSLYSESAATLLMVTTAAETHGARYLRQLGRGPAYGPFQMEGPTHDDIWDNFLKYKSGAEFESIKEYLSKIATLHPLALANLVRSCQVPGLYDGDNVLECAGNFYYAAAMCRVDYLRVREPLPAATDIAGMARYWKRYYNTARGAGDPAEAEVLYRRWIAS